MGEFVRKVQRNEIDGPLKRKFTPTKWSSAFEAIEARDEMDSNLYHAGLAISKKLDAIRQELPKSSIDKLDTPAKLSAMVAMVNYNYYLVDRKNDEAIESLFERQRAGDIDRVNIGNLAAIRLKLSNGIAWSPTEIIEGVVDGIEMPVSFALAEPQQNTTKTGVVDVNTDDVLKEINLGILYRFVGDTWDDCLWNAYTVRQIDSEYIFSPTSLDSLSGYRMGITRRTSLVFDARLQAIHGLRALAAAGRFNGLKEVTSFVKEGFQRRITISRPHQPSDAQLQVYASQLIASEPYYRNLLTEKQPSLGDCTIEQLMSAFGVVASLTRYLYQELIEQTKHSSDTEESPSAWLPSFSPMLPMGALVQAVSNVVSVSPAGAKALIEFLVFRGKQGQELWAQPLVPIGSSCLAPVILATLSPNMRRLFDVWLRQLGVALERRGPAFESHLREGISKQIARSPLLSKTAKCVAHSYTFSPLVGRSEEIDVLMCIGSKVVVAEAKCIVEPTEAKGIATHRKTIEKAAEQARRKSDCIDANRATFILNMKRVGIELAEPFEVIPLIIVSTVTHVGVSVNDVPVVDEHILLKYLEGAFDEVGMAGPELKVVERNSFPFYKSEAEAEENLKDYLANPPQMKPYKGGLRTRPLPILAVSDKDWRGTVETLECIVDT